MDRNHFKLGLHRTEVLRRPSGVAAPIFPLRKKYMASNYTLDGVERKGMDSGSSNFDPDTVMDSKLVPDNAPSEEQQAEPIMVNPDLFSYEETHKVLKDGRIVQRDPVTGKWSKRPAGIAKDIWERLPHLRHHLQLVGPELFTDEELRGGG